MNSKIIIFRQRDLHEWGRYVKLDFAMLHHNNAHAIYYEKVEWSQMAS